MSIEITSIPIHNSYWVIPDRFRAGEHPAAGQESEISQKLRWLMELGINFIVDLTQTIVLHVDYSLSITHEAAILNQQVMYKHIPIEDFSTPSREKMVEILDTIDAALDAGKKIYLHCFGGMGRTGIAVGCYLVRYGAEGERALEMIQEFRKEISGDQNKSPETEGQRRMVKEWIKGQ